MIICINEVSLSKSLYYGPHDHLVDRYGISVSHDMFFFPLPQFRPLFFDCEFAECEFLSELGLHEQHNGCHIGS